MELDDADKFLQQWQKQFVSSDVVLHLEKISHSSVELQRIEVFDPQKRKRGLGAKAINLLTKLADEFWVNIILYPEPVNYEQLKDYYTRFGFVTYKEGEMVYEPQERN